MQINKKILLFAISQFLTVGFYSFSIGFLPMYLADIGQSSTEIALVNLCSTLVTMFTGVLILQLVSPRLNASFLLKVLSVLTVPLFLYFLYSKSLFAVSFSWSLFVFFSLASQILLDVQLLRSNERGEFRYERVRVWGSIGFIFFAFILGVIFDSYGSILSTHSILGLVLLRSLITLKVASYVETPTVSQVSSGLLSQVFKVPVLLLLVTIGLNLISHAPLYVYQSLYFRALGWSNSEISWAWNLSVLAEVAFFLYFKRIESYFKLETVLLVSLIFTSLRWLVMASTTNFYLLLLSELLHAFSFGGCFLASVRLAFQYFPEPYKGKSQGILTLFGTGLGSLIGRYGVKEIGSSYGSYAEYDQMFLIAFWVSMVSCVVGVGLLRVGIGIGRE